MIDQLNAQIKTVAKLRIDAQKASETKIIARTAWENEHRELLDNAVKTAQSVDEAEAKLREITLQVYAETGNKSPAVGVGIREVTKLEYDPKVALMWAKEHELALKLDAPAFEKIAKVDPMTFVKILQVPQATIASVLEP